MAFVRIPQGNTSRLENEFRQLVDGHNRQYAALIVQANRLIQMTDEEVRAEYNFPDTPEGLSTASTFKATTVSAQSELEGSPFYQQWLNNYG